MKSKKNSSVKLTSPKLKKLVNELLVRMEMDYTCIGISRSRFRGQDYEAGAYVWKAHLECEDGIGEVLSFVWFDEIQKCLENGGRLKFDNKSRFRMTTLSDLEITIES